MDRVRHSPPPLARTVRLAATVLAACLAGGCTPEQVYNAAAGWRRDECYKIGDQTHREQCLKDADRPYDAYRGATGARP